MIPTSSNEIIVDSPDSSKPQADSPGGALVSWVMSKVTAWEDHRNNGYSRLWGEYWRMWRGKWSEEDRNKQSERSRLIAPALAQAIEMTASEIEEALFSKDSWFDLADDVADQDRSDAALARDFLLDDLDAVNAPDQIVEAVLNSAIFGTGIVKINTYVGKQDKPSRNPDTKAMEMTSDERVYVTVESIRPDEFIPDPSGTKIADMLGAAHRTKKPLHSVLEKIKSGVYLSSALHALAPAQRPDNKDIDQDDPQSLLSPNDADSVDIVEYHGKVPLKLMNSLKAPVTGTDAMLMFNTSDDDGTDGELVEVIVTIANVNVLLRAMVNPFVMKDRSLIAFQHEKVPGRFWGRGVAEKGYNPQKALDAGVRAYIDALGYVAAPMLGVDAGRVPKGFKMEVKPGKVWLTQGNPNEVLQPVKIGELDTNLFNMTSEMERMVQMGTGAFDTASAIGQQSQSGSNSLSSNSMLMGAFVKRSKRSVKNVERNLVAPIIKKCLWRYMQFDPTRYPKDFEFSVKSGMGIVAREVEAMQMTQLTGMIPEQFGAVSLALTKGIIEHTSLANKAEITKLVDAALQPPSKEEQQQQQELKDLQREAIKAQAQGELLKNQKTLAEIRKLLAESQKIAHSSGVEDDKLMQEQQRLRLMAAEIESFEDQNRISLKRIAQQDEALDIKREELDIKRMAVNKKPSA